MNKQTRSRAARNGWGRLIKHFSFFALLQNPILSCFVNSKMNTAVIHYLCTFLCACACICCILWETSCSGSFFAICLLTFYVMPVISFVGIRMCEREYLKINFPGLQQTALLSLTLHVSPSSFVPHQIMWLHACETSIDTQQEESYHWDVHEIKENTGEANTRSQCRQLQRWFFSILEWRTNKAFFIYCYRLRFSNMFSLTGCGCTFDFERAVKARSAGLNQNQAALLGTIHRIATTSELHV